MRPNAFWTARTEITPLPPVLANGHHHAERLEHHHLVALLDGLEHRLATQPVIEQSKGILIGYFGIDAATAFNMLKRWSSHTNVKLRDISQVLVNTAAATSRADPRRRNEELIDLISCLDAGRMPTRDQVAPEIGPRESENYRIRP